MDTEKDVPRGLVATEHLTLERCPHCFTALPTLAPIHHFFFAPKASSHRTPHPLWWHLYVCQSCGGPVCAACWGDPGSRADAAQKYVRWLVPTVSAFDAAIPDRIRSYLTQAKETLASPSASVLMSASAVDAMLKHEGYKTGSLYSRIEKAADAHLITKDMSEWAHDIRLDANDERHADENAPPPDAKDAARCLDFARTLAEIMFVLPARVLRGREK